MPGVDALARAQLDGVVDLARTVLGEVVVAVYLYGSAARMDWYAMLAALPSPA